MTPIGRVAKAVAALITAVSGWAVMVINSSSGDITSSEWIVLVTGISTALLVYLVPNSYASDTPPVV